MIINKLYRQLGSSSWLENIAVSMFFLAVFVVYTLPFAFNMPSDILGRNDVLQFVWSSFNFEESLNAGNILYTHAMFHPWGADTLMHGGGILTGFVTAPFANKVLVVNILLIIHFLLSATGAYNLSKYLGLQTWFALIVGFIFAFSPYKMARLGEHYNLVVTGFVPFFILYFLKSFHFSSFTYFPKISSYRYVGFAFVFGILQGLMDFVVMFHLLYFAAFWILFSYINKYRIQHGLAAALAVVAGIVFFLHLLTQALVESGANDSGGLWWGGYWVDFVRPDGSMLWQTLVNERFLQLFSRYNMGLEGQVFLGYSLIGVFIFSVWRWLKNSSTFFVNGFLFVLVCIILVAVPEPLGYRLFFSPFSFLHFTPWLTELRCPERIFSLGYLCIAIFTFTQLQAYFQHFHHKLRIFLASALFLALLAEYFPVRYPFTSYDDIPQVVKALSAEPAEAVLAYPLGLRDGYTQDGHYEMMHALYQMHHRKNQLGGYLSRLDAGVRDRYLRNDFARDLILMQDGADTIVAAKDYAPYIDELAFESAMIFHRDTSSRGAVFLDSVLTVNGYARKHCADGYLLLRYR